MMECDLNTPSGGLITLNVLKFEANKIPVSVKDESASLYRFEIQTLYKVYLY